MRKFKRRTFQELVLENKKELMSNREELERIEDRIEQNRINKAE